MSNKVIVFGPTGSVGSVVARTAHAHGATVALAMRDVSKAVPGLDEADEKQGRYQRVQADLTKPDTLKKAVESCGATKAFIYLAFGQPDHMKASIQALKDAGITFVVFLSSFSLAAFGGEAKAIEPAEIIPYIHAQVELNLDEIFGGNKYVALRPGAFATNLLTYKEGISKGELRLHGGDFVMDCITPIDMGEVGGNILAKQSGPKDGQGKVYLYGPQRVAIKDAIDTIVTARGKEVEVIAISDEEGLEQLTAKGTPENLAYYLVNKFGKTLPEEKVRPNYEEGVQNILSYTARPATTLKGWLEDNPRLFD